MITFLAFLLGRLGLKKCEAVLDKDSESYQPGYKGAYLCWTMLLGIFLLASTSITMIGSIGYLQESVGSTQMMVRYAANITQDSINVKTQAKKGYNDEYIPEEYTKRFG